MLSNQFILPLAGELIVDLFAGGGGASTGIEQAIGRHVDVAINHDPEAVSLHEANHPQTRHFVSDVFEVDPRAVTDGRPVIEAKDRAMQILMSSRRTVMSGEVVTFATAFERKDGAFGAMYEAQGPFEVSASRDAVMVHRAECRGAEDSAALAEAVECAEAARAMLAPHWRGGHPSMFPDEPTPTSKPPNVKIGGSNG